MPDFEGEIEAAARRALRRLTHLRDVACEMHRGQVDGQGAPYAEHVLAVAGAVTERAVPVALFHDVMEDERAPREALVGLLSPDELGAVDLLTRPKGLAYAAYIEQIRNAPGAAGDLAREVKIADLRHNHGRLTPELERLRPRYERALAELAG